MRKGLHPPYAGLRIDSEFPAVRPVTGRGGFTLTRALAFQRLYIGLIGIFFLAALPTGWSQTDFAPGEIMFTGYNSDAPDGFSFVLLTDVTSGTDIYITDWGWSNTSGFRVDNSTEGAIRLTFNADYPCGTEVIFTDSEDINDWDNPVNQNGVVVGNVVILAGGDIDGMELGTGGDQLFIYQLPTPTAGNQSSFITAIQMDGAWAGTTNSDDNSAKPNGLSDGQVVVFNTEVDNAKYDCDPRTGTADFLRSQISNNNVAGWLRPDNANNWQENDINNISLATPCNFCCNSNELSGPDIVSANQSFTIHINGILPSGASWQLYTNGCGVGSPVQTTTADSFNITAPGSEGNITYYVRPSINGDCPGQCVYINVCVENTPLAACITCAANPETCGDCLLQDPATNPELDSGCFEIKLIFILDESGSIGGNANDVRAGVLAFLNALNGQDILVAIIEFSCEARYVTPDYTPIDNAFISAMQGYLYNSVPYNGQTYNPNNPGGSCAGTNWHDAMIKADLLTSSDILMFFTDGVPTGWNTSWNDCGNGATTQTPEIVNPVKIANKLKGEGTHMFMLGVGTGINADNLIHMSGSVEYQSGVNTIGNADYSIGNFASLAEDFQEFVTQLCYSPFEIDKQVSGSVCNGRQDFMFIIHNPGTESAVTIIQVIDTFPSGYSNIVYNGPPNVKLCIGSGCDGQGQHQPDNGFIWTTNSLPPGESDTLILSVLVLPTGNYTNRAWGFASNAATVSDTVTSPIFVDDLDPVITCPGDILLDCGESTLPGNAGMATAIDPDGSDPDISYNDVTMSSACPEIYTIARTWSARDGCNNTDDCLQMISVEDTSPPDVNCPADMTVSCADGTLPATTGIATSLDFCDPSPQVAYTDATLSGSCPQSYLIHRTWTSTDACDNSSSCMQVISVEDNVQPSITCPADVTVFCNSSTMPATTGMATGSDGCDGAPGVSYTDSSISGNCPQAYAITRTWRVQDHCGNFITCNQSITLVDNEPPLMTCPANITIQCSSSTLPGTTGQATTTDICDGAPVLTFLDATASLPGCPQRYTITRTWKSTDDCGNFDTCVQIITVDDSTLPVITCPPNVTISCTASTLPANTGNPMTTDNCDGSPVITFTDVTMASPTCSQEYTITRTWRSTDACGNQGTCVQTIVIDDSSIPNINCPANVTIQCTASTLPANTGMATASDNCDLTPDMNYTDVTTAGACPQAHTITRTWHATDDCGNAGTCNQIITVIDNLAPVLNCPSNVTIACTASTLPANTGIATATDNCDATPSVTSSDVITGGACPQTYTIMRTWTATDDCNNATTCLQVIHVQDILSPSITCPANITIECTASTLPANTGSATSTDNCDVSPAISHVDVIINGACPQTYTLQRTWTSTDDCGNTATCLQVIEVVDSTPPVITCPANMTIECTASTLPANTGTASATDACDGAVAIVYNDVLSAPSGCPQQYTITRTWQATDDCGNTQSCVQLITIIDSQPPTITCPANVTIACTANTLPANTGAATASDNCDPSPEITYADVTASSPACPQEYSIQRTWTATDTCGNVSTCVQSILIVDTTLPDITCPPDITILCTESSDPSNTGVATATDNCDGSPELDYVDFTMAIPGTDGYRIERTWTAVDACGNDNTCEQVIIVNNPLDPGIVGLPYDTICSGQSVMFQGTPQNADPVTYQWMFGSGSSPGSANGIGPHNVTYTYNGTNGTIGAFVVLTVTTPGCPPATDTVANVHVNPKPNAVIQTSGGNPCVFQNKTFQPQAAQVPGYTYAWTFGSGANIPNAMGYGPHTVKYSTAGSKTVKLVVWSNAEGASCGDSSTLTFTVNLCPGNITGRVFLNTTTTDTTGIANVNIRLYPDQNLDGMADTTVFVKSVFTNGLGIYSMASITPGYYVIVETQPVPYFSLWDDDTSEDYDSLSNLNPNDNIIPVTIEPNEIDTRNFFVEVNSPGIITGYVFEDFNGNQTPQPIEGIPGVLIDLFTDNDANGVPDGGGLVQSTLTNGIGFYTFGGLSTGNYVLMEHQPNNYNNVKDIDASPDGDIVPNTNMTDDLIPLTLGNAENDADNYFIEQSPCSHLVTSTNDNVPGSLRFAIDCAEAGDTIQFHPQLANQVVHINAGRISIDKDIVIYSTLNPTVRIQSDISGAFSILPGNVVQFRNLNITSGLSGFSGAAFETFGQLLLWDVQIFRNPLLPPGNFLIFSGEPGAVRIKGSLQMHLD